MGLGGGDHPTASRCLFGENYEASIHPKSCGEEAVALATLRLLSFLSLILKADQSWRYYDIMFKELLVVVVVHRG